MHINFTHSSYLFWKERRPLLALITHLFIFCILYLLFYLFVTNIKLPDTDNLLNWDATWYYRLKVVGYYYIEGRQNPLVFFPLFPFLWKVTMLDQLGVSVLNFLLFSISFYFIAKKLALDFLTSLFFLSTPSLFFCYIPYSESLFFFSSTLILLGLESNKKNFLLPGIVIASLTRAVNIIFVPVLIFTYIVTFGYKKRILTPLLIQILMIFIATLSVFYIQYYYTGQWFAMFKVQKLWNRSLQIPTLPLTTLTGSRKLWLDGTALFICILASYDTLKTIKDGFILRKKSIWTPGALFAMAYLSIIGILSVFYSGIWPNQEGTSIMSINRYVFSTPFFIYYAYYKFGYQQGKRLWGELIIVLAITIFCLGGYKTLAGLPSYGATILYFGLIVGYIILYALCLKNRKCSILIYMINTIIQVLLFNAFLSNNWVG